jgi:hypothetical protein
MSEKTVKIRLLTSVTGGVNYAAGEEVFETPEIAADLIKAKHAEPVGVKPSDRSEKATSKSAASAEKR